MHENKKVKPEKKVSIFSMNLSHFIKEKLKVIELIYLIMEVKRKTRTNVFQRKMKNIYESFYAS